MVGRPSLNRAAQAPLSANGVADDWWEEGADPICCNVSICATGPNPCSSRPMNLIHDSLEAIDISFDGLRLRLPISVAYD